MFWDLSAKLVADGQIGVHPPHLGNNGLNGVFDGLQAMRDARVSGQKLVYRVDETD